MRIKLFAAGLAFLTIAFASCDESTDTIGSSLISNVDNLDVSTDTFNVTSKTIIADSVLSRSIIGYLGRVMDPETGDIITGDVMVQLHAMENYSIISEDSIISRLDGKVIADSCKLSIIYNSFYGDSLSQMKLNVYEMAKPFEEGTEFYSNYDPVKEGYIRVGEGAVNQSRSYTLADNNYTIAERSASSYKPKITINLNDPYTDLQGNTYNNYGTYLLRQYFSNPSNFKNQYLFTHQVIPGFYFKMTGGLGSMAQITTAQLSLWFRVEKNDSILKYVTSFTGTEEVLQTTNFTNDKALLKQMAEDNSCTYLKTPAGLFTEVTLPVDEIMSGHQNDSVNSARIEIPRVNNTYSTNYSFDIPPTILMIPKDSLHSFFAQSKIADYRTSFLASYSSSTNKYVFYNISGLINKMYKSKQNGGENWNKAVLIPVSTEYSTTSSNSSVLSKVTHDMSLTSTKLVGGSLNPDKLKISIVYGKFNGR